MQRFDWPLTHSARFEECSPEDQEKILKNLEGYKVALSSEFSRDGKFVLEPFMHEVLDMVCFLIAEPEENPSVNWVAVLVGKIVEAARAWEHHEMFEDFLRRTSVIDMCERLRAESQVIQGPLDSGRINMEMLIHKVQEPSDLPSSAGHYLAIMTDDNDSTWCRMYVGQALKVKPRVLQHVSQHVNKEKPLFYWQWAKPGRKVTWVLLSQVSMLEQESDEDRAMWLTIAETFYSLAFRTLQFKQLTDFLGPLQVVPGQEGLNVRLPLYQGRILRGSDSGFGALFSSTDTETLTYAQEHMVKMGEKAVQANEALDYKHSAKAITAKIGKVQIREWREGDPVGVQLRCNGCRADDSIHIDSHPRFTVKTNQYVADKGRCYGSCEPTASMKAQG